MNKNDKEKTQFWIAALELHIDIPYAASLKDRRQIVRSLTDGVRSRFSISAADLGPSDMYNIAVLGFTASASGKSELEERVGNLRNFIHWREEEGEFEVIEFTSQILNYDDLSN